MKDYWFSKPKQYPRIIEFRELVAEYKLEPVWPDKERAPWHVMATVGRGGRYPQKIQFWPHQMKAYWEGRKKPAVGPKPVRKLLDDAIERAYEGDDFDVVEDDDAETVS